MAAPGDVAVRWEDCVSGVAGLYGTDGTAVDGADLERMLQALAHRGPDGATAWRQGAVGFGHRMLRTTPESLAEKLPLFRSDRDLAITADARIDNRTDLIQQLGLSDREPETLTDSELILAAYERWGEDCPQHLMGDFAFAIWDGRAQRLFCARDPFGVKPFYYYWKAGRLFAFASELKGLLCLPEIPRRINEERVADYLIGYLEDATATFYEGLLRLPPAHSMTVTREGLRQRRYWSLDPERELRLGSDEEYAEAFREIFTEAVRCRVRSAHPVGSMLSGGLDSSSIACTARMFLAELPQQRLHTFSYIFPGLSEEALRQIDEREYISAVLEGGGFEPHFVRGDEVSPLGDVDRMLRYQDEPTAAPNLFLNWGLHEAVQGAQIRVLLDGFGGDSIVSHGTARLHELAHKGNWGTFAGEAMALASRDEIPAVRYLEWYGVRHLVRRAKRGQWVTFARDVQHIHQHFGISRKRLYTQCGIKPVVSAMAVTSKRWHGSRPQTGGLRVRPELARRQRLPSKARLLDQTKAAAPTCARIAHREEVATALEMLALEENDRTAAVAGVESRYPFFDRRLAEFCLALPADQKLGQGWSRRVLRQAMTGILPEVVRVRTTKGILSPNFTQGLRLKDRDRLQEALSRDTHPLEPYLCLETLHVTCEAYLSSGGTAHELELLRASLLGIWLRSMDSAS